METILSVIIPCYNDEKYIDECISSVLGQNIKNVEIILVDDASTDDTYDICKAYERLYSFIKLIHHSKNEGQESARNDGLSIAKGNWILFLDGDDLLGENSVNSVLTHIDESIDIVISKFVYFDEMSSYLSSRDLMKKIITSHEMAQGIGNTISWELVSCIGNKLYRRDFLNSNNLRFNAKYKYNEDGAFAIDAFMKAGNIKFVNETWYYYRYNISGTMSSYKKDAYVTLNTVNDLLCEYFDRESCLNEKIDYVNKKRIGSLVSSLYSEIRYGSKSEFFNQIKVINPVEERNKWMLSVCNSDHYDVFEKSFIRSIIENEYDYIFESVKKDTLTYIYKRLMVFRETKKSIFASIKEQGINEVEIYGAGEIGRMFSYFAVKEGVRVICFIDQRVKGPINGNIKCINPEEETIPPCLLILNTTLLWNRDIESYIKNKSNSRVISIKELLI